MRSRIFKDKEISSLAARRRTLSYKGFSNTTFTLGFFAGILILPDQSVALVHHPRKSCIRQLRPNEARRFNPTEIWVEKKRTGATGRWSILGCVGRFELCKKNFILSKSLTQQSYQSQINELSACVRITHEVSKDFSLRSLPALAARDTSELRN